MAAITGSPLDDEVSRWVSERDTVMTNKLAAVGLIPKRASATLGVFLQNYLDKRADIKSGTAVFYRHTETMFNRVFWSG